MAQEVAAAYSLERARPEHLARVLALDQDHLNDVGRSRMIERAVSSGACHIALEAGQIVAYAILEHSFYEQPFVSLLYVAPEHRRRQAGTLLLRHLEGHCQGEKIFTSTNVSNQPMQALLAKAGYSLSGVIHNLDEGDPELVYFKRLAHRGRSR